MKITAVCDNDLGTNLMVEMSIKSILKDLSVSTDTDHVDLDSAKGTPSGICVGTKDITGQLAARSVTDKIVTLEDMIDKKVMRERLSVVLTGLGTL